MNIVIIDSGVGAEEIIKTLLMKDLSNNYTLLLDKSFFPYGNKTKEQLENRYIYLLSKISDDVELVIIGCNTLSIMIDDFKTNKKVIDMISITKSYLETNNFSKVLMLGTYNTVLKNPFNTPFFIIVDELIEAIQYGDYEKQLQKLFSMIDDSYDAIILGCTHLIKVKNEFRNKFNCCIISQDELIELPKSTVKIKEV
ncbi:MAG: hypothetical protein R3Y60_01350 [bacterium]